MFIPLIEIVSPSTISCGSVVIPIISFLFNLKAVLTNVDMPISTVSISLPRSSSTTIFAPVPFVPLESKVRVSPTLYPSPLEKIVTEVIPALLVLVTSNSCFRASLTSSISS